ncbi:unnamed protein product [Cuscuta campestris]|uniref:Uncharacterized protein n=1 Tax=Cuscuta campestris TaxID=132261 RepID=A0A484KII2_9ASTE|nr:unnamed protein product [Cuscuta campestris]
MTTAGSDEFKYGFPSNAGLSVVSYKWWGSKSCDGGGYNKEEEEDGSKERKQPLVDAIDKSEFETGNDKTHGSNNADSMRGSLLSQLREEAAREGREAMSKVGVYQGNDLFKLEDFTKKKGVSSTLIWRSGLK